MRRILLGTSALVAVGFVTLPAMAELTLTISGFYRFDAAFVDESGDGTSRANLVVAAGVPTAASVTTRNYDFSSRARLVFDAAGTADNGLKYGARIRLHESFGSLAFNEIDQSYGYVQGSFGRVAFGDIESAGSLLRVYAPDSAGTGIANGTWSNFAKGYRDSNYRTPIVAAAGATGFPQGISSAALWPTTGNWDDVVFGSAAQNSYSSKIVYTTTGINLAGFTFGFSYAPEIGNRGRDYDRNATFATTTATPRRLFEDAISVAVQYANPNLFNNFGLKFAGQYNHANARRSNIEDLQTWMLGAQLTYAGFTVGGHYIDNGDSGAATTNAVLNGVGGTQGLFGSTAAGIIRHTGFQQWGAGVEYTVGPWTVGFNYFAANVDGLQATANAALTQLQEYELQAYGGGVSYVVAPGLTVGADIVHYEEDVTQRAGFAANPLRANDGTLFSLRTQVTF